MRQISLSLFTFILAFSWTAYSKFKTPWLSGPVIDEVGILSPAHKAEIERMLQSFNQRDMAQIQVFVTSSLQGLEIEQASIDIVDQWNLGSKEKDNGVLFLIAPNEKKVRIEVGQGLEGILTDLTSNRINEEMVVPYFRQGQMSEGVFQGIRGIITVLDGEELQATAKPKIARESRKVSLPFWAIVLIWIVIIFLGRMGGGRGRRLRGGTWIGGGGFGGLGGGGFGGGGGWSGGGGGFSGGGSSSSW